MDQPSFLVCWEELIPSSTFHFRSCLSYFLVVCFCHLLRYWNGLSCLFFLLAIFSGTAKKTKTLFLILQKHNQGVKKPRLVLLINVYKRTPLGISVFLSIYSKGLWVSTPPLGDSWSLSHPSLCCGRENTQSVWSLIFQKTFFPYFGSGKFLLSKDISETQPIPWGSLVSTIYFLQGVTAGMVALSN